MSEQDRKKGDPVLGAKLRKMRKQARLTQEQLADKTGVNASTISRIEIGVRSPSSELLHSWYQQCGYVLEGVEVGNADQATSIARAIAEIPQGQLDEIVSILRAWPGLTDKIRGRILGLAEANDA